MNLRKFSSTLGYFISLFIIMSRSVESFAEISPVRNRSAPFLVTRKSFRPPPLPGCPAPSCKDCVSANLMICRAVSDFSDESSASDDEKVGTPSGKTRRSGIFAGLQQRVFSKSTVKERLLKASNFASMLCVLDCTILPVITIVLPLFGIVAASPAHMEWLHELGHQLALVS